MTYTAPSTRTLRMKKGTITEKIADELALIDTELDMNKSKFVVLTPGEGTNTAQATSGIDLASGSDIQLYGVFVAPVDITVVSMKDYLTEAYVKETSDAKLEIYDDAGTPVKIFGRTLTAGGEAAKNFTSTTPETGVANIDAGTRLDLKAVHTDSTTGTGHAIVILEYIER